MNRRGQPRRLVQAATGSIRMAAARSRALGAGIPVDFSMSRRDRAVLSSWTKAAETRPLSVFAKPSFGIRRNPLAPELMLVPLIGMAGQSKTCTITVEIPEHLLE